METCAPSVFEGAFASRVIANNLETLAPYSSALAGPGGFRAAPGGVLQGRFGFGSASTARVSNAQQSPSDVLGVVVPLQSVNYANGTVVGGPAKFGGPQAQFTWQTWDRPARAWRLRAGLVCTLMTRGKFWLRFPGGASYGSTVYASTANGVAISGAADGAIETPWTVCGNCGPGALAVVSSTAFFP
jgi:hypothetical protein